MPVYGHSQNISLQACESTEFASCRQVALWGQMSPVAPGT